MNTILQTSINKLISHIPLVKEEFVALLSHNSPSLRQELAAHATREKQLYFKNHIYIRGLIEISNHCKNDCYYCGVRCSNHSLSRYRLTPVEILSCCERGYQLGCRTFVLQSGEDGYYTDNLMTDIIFAIHRQYPDCAITLSLGEKSFDSYELFFQAGATRYLLREETADASHYSQLHPNTMSLENRIQCLQNLKKIGYQVGCGFLVGSPYQTVQNIASDLLFIQEFKPDMVGIGPFIAQKDTPFKEFANGSFQDTLLLLSILRLLLPDVLLPATTALGTIATDGKEQGILAGANVIMPNLTPASAREKYQLYDNKNNGDPDAEIVLNQFETQLEAIGHKIVIHRGDALRIS